MIRGLGVGVLMAAAALECLAQASKTPALADELAKAGIPNTGFTGVELAQAVNAESARNGDQVYLAYMRVNERNMFTGFPQVIRYESATGRVIRKELAVGEGDNCCGSPLHVSFTQSYELFEFHISPSAGLIIVADRELSPVARLYGFEVKEIAPDEVIFTEDMVHFAPAHPERIMYSNLRTGASQELYPPKNDPLRVAFAHEHKQHLPAPDVCMAMNDPCNPDFFDETIMILRVDAPARFLLRVSRNAVHAPAKDADPESVVSDEAINLYERREGNWFYCSMRVNEKADCQPNTAVVVDGEAEFMRPIVRSLR